MDNFDLRKFLTEGKLHEAMFDVEATEKIAQHIADAFTAEDNELDLKYVVSPGTEAGHFDLDVEAGENTPGEDWKDENGFGIENYLGKYAGGSFLIKDGIVINAAMRSAPVAKVSPEGEVEMISAEESRAAIGMEESEEKKSSKMTKSELKEMIRNAFLNEADEEEDVEDVDVDVEDEVDVEDVDVDVDVEDAGEIDVEDDAKVELTGDKREVSDNLEAALEAARALGDEKLVDQIGNTITFFTRAHIVKETDMLQDEAEMEL